MMEEQFRAQLVLLARELRLADAGEFSRTGTARMEEVELSIRWDGDALSVRCDAGIPVLEGMGLAERAEVYEALLAANPGLISDCGCGVFVDADRGLIGLSLSLDETDFSSQLSATWLEELAATCRDLCENLGLRSPDRLGGDLHPTL